MVKILFVNNLGGGYADYVEVAKGTTVDKFFSQKMPNSEAGDYLIRVNRQPVPRDYVLQEGDRLTCTPVKIEGARSVRVAQTA
jgi:sulfur carrier protein ThiS